MGLALQLGEPTGQGWEQILELATALVRGCRSATRAGRAAGVGDARAQGALDHEELISDLNSLYGVLSVAASDLGPEPDS